MAHILKAEALGLPDNPQFVATVRVRAALNRDAGGGLHSGGRATASAARWRATSRRRSIEALGVAALTMPWSASRRSCRQAPARRTRRPGDLGAVRAELARRRAHFQTAGRGVSEGAGRPLSARNLLRGPRYCAAAPGIREGVEGQPWSRARARPDRDTASAHGRSPRRRWTRREKQYDSRPGICCATWPSDARCWNSTGPLRRLRNSRRR